MAPRLELQALLETILGSSNVYFQPPSNVEIQYPCIVYNLDNARTEFAGNLPYLYTKRYMVTHIARDPDTLVPDKLARLPMAIFSRYYAANNLNHYVLNLYF